MQQSLILNLWSQICGTGLAGEFATFVLRIGMDMNVVQGQLRAGWYCLGHPSHQTIDLVEIPQGSAGQWFALAVNHLLANGRMVVTKGRRSSSKTRLQLCRSDG